VLNRRWLATGPGLVLLVGVVVWSCGQAPFVGGSQPTAKQTVRVRIGDIDSVLTLDATVVAEPTYVIGAPAAGLIHLEVPPAQSGALPLEIGHVSGSGASSPVMLPAYSVGVEWLVSDGSPVTYGLPVALATYSGFALAATPTDAELYRLYGPAASIAGEIKQGPGPFDCPQIGTLGPSPQGQSTGPIALPSAGSSGFASQPGSPQQLDTSGPIVLLCVAPRDLLLFRGMLARVGVTTAQAHGVLVLPVEAVAGSSQRGRVQVVLANGTNEYRDVTLGITDGVLIEIKSGLKAGDEVVTPGPFLDGSS
jgi:hypothetical protein